MEFYLTVVLGNCSLNPNNVGFFSVHGIEFNGRHTVIKYRDKRNEKSDGGHYARARTERND